MMKKSKSTKQVRAIDRIIKFQLDDGIESLTISGKEALADVSIDNKANVTLFLNADKDKLNEIKSLVPFITLETKSGGTDPNETKAVELSQDLTQFALEIADNSKDLASLVKEKSTITIDFDGLVQKLLEIAGKLVELERKNQEQDERMTTIEEKNVSQDGKLTQLENNLATVEQNQENQANTLTNHGERLTILENSSGGSVGGFTTKTIATVQPFYENADMYTDDVFSTTKTLKCVIAKNRSIRDGVLFITIHRYLTRYLTGEMVMEIPDGSVTVTAMIDEYSVANSDLIQEHFVKMNTIASGVIELRCELVNYSAEQEFKLYDLPKDATETYKISINGFKFVEETVLAPEAEIIF